MADLNVSGKLYVKGVEVTPATTANVQTTTFDDITTLNAFLAENFDKILSCQLIAFNSSSTLSTIHRILTITSDGQINLNASAGASEFSSLWTATKLLPNRKGSDYRFTTATSTKHFELVILPNNVRMLENTHLASNTAFTWEELYKNGVSGWQLQVWYIG